MFACVHVAGRGDVELSALVGLACDFSPKVERTAPETVVLDIAGCERIFGPPHEIADRLARRAWAAGLDVSIAVAPNPDAAIHAARGIAAKNTKGTKDRKERKEREDREDIKADTAATAEETVTETAKKTGITTKKAEGRTAKAAAAGPRNAIVIGPGEQSKTLSKLPLEILDPSLAGVEEDRAREILETLELWGIRTFGEFARLPEAGVSERLGPEGVRLQRLARGTSDRALTLIAQPPSFENSTELDHPIELLEPLSFVLAHLLGQLCDRLKAFALATNEVRLTLTLEEGALNERAIRLPFPTRDHRALLKLLLLDIESRPPDAAVIGIAVAAEPVNPRVIQNGLFTPLAPEPDKLELTVARIAKLVGAENVGSVELMDTHRPGAFRMKPGRIIHGGHEGHEEKYQRAACVLGFRVFRPPLRARVETRRGRPVKVSSVASRARQRGPDQATRRSGTRACLRPTVRGGVLESAGPWRTTGDWWTSDEWARDEWDVAIGDPAALYRIYRELSSGSWFIEGSYD